ncbi:unnamed protein product, partial [Vitis vinifera]
MLHRPASSNSSSSINSSIFNPWSSSPLIFLFMIIVWAISSIYIQYEYKLGKLTLSLNTQRAFLLLRRQ